MNATWIRSNGARSLRRGKTPAVILGLWLVAAGGVAPGGVPGTVVPADFDGDLKADPAAVDTAGRWHIWFSGQGYTHGGPFALNSVTGTPVASDFDGDGKADPAVATSTGDWYIWFSSQGYARGGPFNFAIPQDTILVSATGSDRFDPDSIMVNPGQVVQWRNDDIDHHTVGADAANAVSGGPNSDSEFPSGIPSASTFSWTVPQTAVGGTVWYYHCRFHGAAGDGHGPGTGMAGTITVQ